MEAIDLFSERGRLEVRLDVVSGFGDVAEFLSRSRSADELGRELEDELGRELEVERLELVEEGEDWA